MNMKKTRDIIGWKFFKKVDKINFKNKSIQLIWALITLFIVFILCFINLLVFRNKRAIWRAMIKGAREGLNCTDEQMKSNINVVIKTESFIIFGMCICFLTASIVLNSEMWYRYIYLSGILISSFGIGMT